MMQDLRLAVRLLLKTPGFTLVAVLTLALGIGANTAIFTVVDGVLLRPAPVAEIERLALVWETDRNSGTTREPASVPDFLDYAARSHSFQTMAAIMGAEVNLTPREGNPIRLAALRTTHRFLPMLGIRPIAGRSFTEEEDRAGGAHVAMLSESQWERSFGRDPKVLGETLWLDDLPYTIVGVAADMADFGILQVLSAAAYSRSFADRGDRSEVDVWMPLQADPERSPRSTHPIFILGRLAAGVGAGPAQKELAAIAADLEREHRVNDGRGVFVEPFEAVVFGPVRPALLVLLGAVALVLLVSCVNVGNLLLARGARRAREIAVRSALGAAGARLARQFLIENLPRAIVAAAAGVGLAFTGLKTLLAIAPPDLPRLGSVAIDFRVLAVTAVASLLAGLVFRMVP
ncbi:MAG: ABC transporter permease, partial [Acidobacteriota bacterium]